MDEDGYGRIFVSLRRTKNVQVPISTSAKYATSSTDATTCYIVAGSVARGHRSRSLAKNGRQECVRKGTKRLTSWVKN